MSAATYSSKCALASNLALNEMIGRSLPVSSNAALKRMDGSSIQNFESTGAPIVCWICHHLVKINDKKPDRDRLHEACLFLHRPAGEQL